MKKILLIFIFFSLYTCAWGVTISGLAFTKVSYEQFEKAEATFTLGTTYSNPYDSTIVQADAEITLPGGAVIFVPCFYYVPCTYYANTPTWWESTENTGAAKWMLRYCPTLTGTYNVRIRVLDGATSWSGSVSFATTASARKGFVRLDATNPQFMRFDNGTPYYPNGVNLCWNDGRLTETFREYLTTLDNNGVNWMRYWFTDFARQALEWRSGHWSGYYNGLGRYSQRSAGILDSVVAICQQRDIYIQLVLQHHGQVSTSVNPEWADNPHNAANGGPCAASADFFTNVTSRAYTKKMYRYVVARWGYSPNIMSWELFNEVEFSDGTDAAIDTWHDEMSRYLKYQDPNDHLVNTSAGGDNSTLALFDNNTAMDQLQWHTYSGGINNVLHEEAETFIPAYNKPVMCGEFGLTTAYPGGGAHPDDWADHVRKTIWTMVMSEAPSMFWYWDTYIRDKNLFSVFQPFANYLQGEDLVARTNGANRKTIKFSTNPVVSGTIYVTPPQNAWGGTNAPNPFTSVIDAEGNISNLSGLHSYLHGSWQGTRNREVTFTVTFQTGGAAVQLDVNGVSASGSKSVQVFVDGALQTTWNPAGAGLFTYTGIAAGTHTIRLYNPGQDWIGFNDIRFTNVAYYRCKAYGYTGTQYAYGYINDISYGDYADPAGITNVTGAVLRVGPMATGSYNVEYWNPQTGATSSGGTIATTLDSLTLVLPSFKKDLAYKITPVTLPIKLLNFYGVKEEEGVSLFWHSLEEINAPLVYDVQRWSGTAFETIGQVESQTGSAYRYTDYAAQETEALYRLKWNENGQTYFSPVVRVGSEELTWAVESPAGHELTVFTGITENTRIQILDIQGRVLLEEEKIVQQGKITVEISHLLPGMYFLRFPKTAETQRFVHY